MGTTALQLRNF